MDKFTHEYCEDSRVKVFVNSSLWKAILRYFFRDPSEELFNDIKRRIIDYVKVRIKKQTFKTPSTEVILADIKRQFLKPPKDKPITSDIENVTVCKYYDVRSYLTEYFNRAYDNDEVIFVYRVDNKNVAIININRLNDLENRLNVALKELEELKAEPKEKKKSKKEIELWNIPIKGDENT